MKNHEVVYFEGLPRSGKTTLTGELAAENPHILLKIDEYVHPALTIDGIWDDQRIFMENDELKYLIARASGQQCLVDRGHLSTLLYSHVYNQIKADRDLKFVDDWYFGKILKNTMLPDRYVFLDVTPETSLARRRVPLDTNNMWDHLEALKFARENYPRYMGTYESEIPVLTLSSSLMTISELKNKLVPFLGLKVRGTKNTSL